MDSFDVFGLALSIGLGLLIMALLPPLSPVTALVLFWFIFKK